MTVSVAVTTASMFSFHSVKICSNELSIVSVKTYVPVTIITPSTIRAR